MSSIPQATRPTRGRAQTTRPTHRGGYRSAIEAAEKRGKQQTDDALLDLAGNLVKHAHQQYWKGYANGLTDFAKHETGPTAEAATEAAAELAAAYSDVADTRDWTLPAGSVLPGTEVPDVEHLPCPSWCVDCGRGEPGSGDHTRYHHGAKAGVPAKGSLAGQPYGVEVTIDRFDDGASILEDTSIYVAADGRDGVQLTPATARQLAAHLLNAADTMDGEL